MKQEFLTYLLGEGSGGQFLAAIVYGFVGAFLSLLLGTTKRDPLSDRSPEAFSWAFLWSDNSKRVYRSVLFILLTIRFSRELLGSEITMYLALLIGLGVDQLAERWKNKVRQNEAA
jgi:hypothetical protein